MLKISNMILTCIDKLSAKSIEKRIELLALKKGITFDDAIFQISRALGYDKTLTTQELSTISKIYKHGQMSGRA